MKVETFNDGVAICGDCTHKDVLDEVRRQLGEEQVHLIATDPPYGNIIKEDWDRWGKGQKAFVDWMLSWTKDYADVLIAGGAFYIWGGYGVPGFRPFFEYSSRVEGETNLRISNFLTWMKKRARGLPYNYLACREDIVFMINGEPKKPAVFNVPYLDVKRGYSGYNPKYPAKSEYYRRTNVWTDVTELLSGKVHPTQKPLRVAEVPIEVSTNQGQWVLDPFAGSMTTAFAARRLERKWICIEKDESIFDEGVAALRNGSRKR